MYFRLIAFGYFLVLVSASGEEKTPNPTAISALKTILEDYDGVTGDSDLQGCSSNNCPTSNMKCCAVGQLVAWCCPEKCLSLEGNMVDCRCFEKDDVWYCAGGARFVLNIWIIVALALFTIKWIN